MATILQWDSPWTVLTAEVLLKDEIFEGMLVYDRIDDEVPSAHFKSVESLWTQAKTLRTEGLGHVRLLKDEKVIEQVVDYLKIS